MLVFIMSLSFIGVSFASIGTARLRRRMDFHALLRLGIAQTLVHATASVILASRGWGATGMAWASVLGIWAGVVGVYLYFPKDILMLPSFKAYRRVIDYGVFASTASMLQDLSFRAPDIIIGRSLGFDQAGLYSRGNGLVGLLEQALMGALTAVAVSALAVLHRANEDMRPLFLRFMGATTAVAWPFLGMMAMLSLPIIRICFGSQWLAGAPVAQVLCVGAAFQVVGQMGNILFLACGKARRMLIVQLVSVPIQVLLMGVGSLFNIEAAALGVFASNLVMAAIALHQINQVIGPVWKPIFRELAVSALITAATMIVPAAVQIFHGITLDDLWGPTLFAGFGGGVSWLAIIFLLGHPLGEEIVLFLRKIGILPGRPDACPAIDPLAVPAQMARAKPVDEA
jgi:O-antigen/teichoic acid export membrane protein